MDKSNIIETFFRQKIKCYLALSEEEHSQLTTLNSLLAAKSNKKMDITKPHCRRRII